MANGIDGAMNTPPLERRQGIRLRRRGNALPLVRLLLYYAVIVGLGALIINLVPGGHHIIAAPLSTQVSDGAQMITGKASAAGARLPPDPWGGATGRMALAFLATIGALAIALPVAWVHMLTRRLRYSPSLVHTMVMLPMVVAGIVMVVKGSLALAFALAGIVAGVRFRQKLSEPKEAVYVLLALGIGLAAGVQALDLALAVSLAFNIVVLVIWRYDVGSLEGRSTIPLLAVGDTSLLPLGEDRRVVHQRAVQASAGMETDGILVVYAKDADAARHGIEVTLLGRAEEWRITRPVQVGERSRFEVVLQLAGKTEPLDVLGELEERWAGQLDAVEYIPFRRRNSDEDDDD